MVWFSDTLIRMASAPVLAQGGVADLFNSSILWPATLLAALIVALAFIAIFLRYFRLWIQSVTTGAGIGLLDLVRMSLRKVNPAVITRGKIMAVQAGIYDSEGLTTKALEAHYLAGGNVPLVILSMIAARKAKIFDLSFKRATAIDLAGRNLLEAVQTSVYPRVIDCPPNNSKRPTLDAVAKNGVQLNVKARVTVRTNLDQLIGGATEETIVARVGESIVSAIGAAETHKVVLKSPDLISKAVLARKLDSQTAFEIVSIDIAHISVGDNIGARLQADQAEADTRVARAQAEGRRAMAVSQEQENIRASGTLWVNVARYAELRQGVLEINLLRGVAQLFTHGVEAWLRFASRWRKWLVTLTNWRIPAARLTRSIRLSVSSSFL